MADEEVWQGVHRWPRRNIPWAARTTVRPKQGPFNDLPRTHLQYAMLSFKIVPFCVLHFTHMPRAGRVLPDGWSRSAHWVMTMASHARIIIVCSASPSPSGAAAQDIFGAKSVE